MRTRTWIPLGLLLLASAAPPPGLLQDAPPEIQETSLEAAQEECDALMDAVDAAVKKWISDYQAEVKKAQEEGTNPPAFAWGNSPAGKFVEKFQASADKYAGTDAAIPFLAWISKEGSRFNVGLAKSAVETLCFDHGSSEALVPHAESFGDWIWILGRERGAEILAELESESSVPAIVGWAVYHRLGTPFGDAEVGSEAYNAIKAELLAACEKSKDKRLNALVNQKIRLQEVFGVGVVAPDIKGIDLDGTEFALSDYKGKVIFLDFWGDW